MDLALVRSFSGRVARAMMLVQQLWGVVKTAYEPRKFKGLSNIIGWHACYNVLCYILWTLSAVDRACLERCEAKVGQKRLQLH